MDQDNKQATTNAQPQKQLAQQSEPSHHSHSAKFTLLVILATVVLLLLWVATLPLNYHHRDAGAAGPRTVLQKMLEPISESTGLIREFTNTNSNTE